MTTDSAVQNFAHYLQGLDDSKRASALARAKMLAMQEAPQEAFEPPIQTLGDYLDSPIEVPPSLVYPTVVVRGEITTVLGRAGLGKTTYNLNRILRWGAGKPLFGDWKDAEGKCYLAPEKPLKILVIENEGAAGMFHHKMGLLVTRESQFSAEDRKLARENVLVWGDGGYQGLKLDDAAKVNLVRAGCEKWEPDILFVEPFRGLWRGDENSSTDMANIVDELIGIATDFNLGVILSHHERKSGAGEDGELMSAGRGSTVLEGAVALMENFQKVKGGDLREITWSKARYLQPPPPTRMEYEPVSGWYNHIPASQLEDSILQVLLEADTGMNATSVAALLEEKRDLVSRTLGSMHKDGRLKRNQGHSDGSGSTGYVYRPVNVPDSGGLSI